MSNDIRNNENASQYETTIDGITAYVSYDLEGDDRIVLTHTIVPEALSGRGLAGELVKFAMEDAKTRNLKVVPQCSYVQAWLKRNPDYQAMTTTSA